MFYDELKKYYKGFVLKEPVGNNAFSHAFRRNKTLFVAPFKFGSLDQLKVSKKIAFSEIVDGVEINCHGLESFVYHPRHDYKTFIIFDNHNHAFFLWAAAFNYGLIAKDARLVHVDQHTDMREPPDVFYKLPADKFDLKKVFGYTQEVLNVGCFIKPALDTGIFSSVTIVQNSEDFKKEVAPPFVLDLDLDIFAPELDYMPFELKIKKIRQLIDGANFITIATSPFFMDQVQAIKLVKILIE